MSKSKLTDNLSNNSSILSNSLSDSEIIKALECCCNDDIADKQNLTECYSCPLVSDMECTYTLRKHTLDLITRLQAENERLKPFEDKIAEFNSHIRVEDMLVFASSLEEWLEFCENLKAEAYKEFAERLEAEYTDFDEENEVILPENLNKAINDLLKELVGEDDG